MAQAHRICTGCGLLGLYQYAAADVGGPDWPPVCGCGSVTEAAPQPGDLILDLHTDGGTDQTFQKFTVQREQPIKLSDGTWGLAHKREEIDSLHKLRAIERDSDTRAANGEGERIRFRMYQNDHSNKDVNTFGPAPDAAPAKKRNIGVQRHGDRKPTVTLGPGVPKSGVAGV